MRGVEEGRFAQFTRAGHISAKAARAVCFPPCDRAGLLRSLRGSRIQPCGPCLGGFGGRAQSGGPQGRDRDVKQVRAIVQVHGSCRTRSTSNSPATSAKVPRSATRSPGHRGPEQAARQSSRNELAEHARPSGATSRNCFATNCGRNRTAAASTPTSSYRRNGSPAETTGCRSITSCPGAGSATTASSTRRSASRSEPGQERPHTVRIVRGGRRATGPCFRHGRELQGDERAQERRLLPAQERQGGRGTLQDPQPGRHPLCHTAAAGHACPSLPEGRGKRHVLARPGQLTAKLRRAWGLDDIKKDEDGKRKEDDRHHALDAIVVAATSEAMLQQLTKAAQEAERQGLPRGSISQGGPAGSRIPGGRAGNSRKVFVSRAERRRARGEAHAARSSGSRISTGS